ncbi:MAG: hypothetical protein RL757_665 [Bacteroidota bacterium]
MKIIQYLRSTQWRKLLNIFVSVYLLAAFMWSIYLLDRQTDAAMRSEVHFMMRSEALKAETQIDLKDIAFAERDSMYVTQQKPYLELIRKYERKKNMIFWEGAFALLFLGSIIFAIQRSYRRELQTVKMQNNFLLSITHELKSPLASMKLGFDTIQKRQLTEAQLNKVATNGLKESERLATLIENLLFSTRLGSTYKIEKEEISVQPFLADIVQHIQTKSPQAKIVLEGSEIPILRADRLGMMSVFVNLIENAVKYGDKTAPVVAVNYGFEKGKIWVSIADNGLGIPDKEKDRVFKQFYRIGDENHRQTKGTGLGLFIVKEVVQQHKGIISISNNKPQGTIFKIILKS